MADFKRCFEMKIFYYKHLVFLLELAYEYYI